MKILGKIFERAFDYIKFIFGFFYPYEDYDEPKVKEKVYTAKPKKYLKKKTRSLFSSRRAFHNMLYNKRRFK